MDGLQGAELLRTLVYPESRSQFVRMVVTAGLHTDLFYSLDSNGSDNDQSLCEFWSSSCDLQDLIEIADKAVA